MQIFDIKIGPYYKFAHRICGFFYKGGTMHSSAFSHTEPMTLGSPPVNSIGTGSSTSPGTCQYLPGFLMSENPQVLETVSTSSESKVSRQNAFSLSGNSHNIPASQYNNKLQPRYLSQAHDSIGRRLTSPPTRSMWSTVGGAGVRSKPSADNFGGIKHSTPNYTLGSSTNPPVKQIGVSPFQSPGDSSYHRTPLHNVVNNRPPLVGSPLHNNSILANINDGNKKQDVISTPDRLAEALLSHRSSNDFDNANPHDCWVTVFGFPPSRAAFILNQFAQLGTIEKHVITNSGNWMHIKYQNKMQAHCALNKNGKVFGDNTMVGVSVCNDSEVMNDDKCGLFSKQTNPCSMNDSLFLSPSNVHHNPMNMKRTTDENCKTTTGAMNKTPLRDLSGLRSLNGVGGVGNGATNSGIDSANIFADKSANNIGRHNSMRSLAASTRPTNLSRTTSGNMTTFIDSSRDECNEREHK
ncbi:unnamed protein product [Schistosoma bovis]|nr:unnamed protein product [Schistosoma bovis]